MYSSKKILAGVILIASLFINTGVVFAAGNINPALNYSQFLDKDLDNNGTKDFINWNPTNGGATVSDTTVTGYIWGETVGWINLGPFTNAGSSAGVKNTCDGDLSGYAWGQNTGWINFAPTYAVGANEPRINPNTGDITGSVWAQNYGWITLNSSYGWIVLNSSNGTYPGLNTTWRPDPNCSTPVDVCPGLPGIQTSLSDCTDGGGGLDLCSNIPNVQSVVEPGYYKVPATPGVTGECFPIINQNDLCTNIAGVQTTVPAFHTKDPVTPGVPGVCSPDPVDVCPNKPGLQTNINECPGEVDVCPNKPGNQTSPSECPPPPPVVDVCPNLSGDQEVLPPGYQFDQNGNCVVVPPPDGDACPGIPGNQTSINECPPAPPIDVCPTVPGVQISVSECPDDFQGDSESITGTSTFAFLAGPLDFLNENNIGWILPVVGVAAGIPGLITRFGNLILTFVFRRKKMRGIVYDAVTKEPLDPAYVSVIDMATNQEVFSAITDMDGRYGFVLKKGTYKIVANKTHYQFPSQLLQGRMMDEVYDHLYFGEPFTVENEEEVVTRNIPMDPTAQDWNQQEKRRMNPLKYLIENQKLWGTVCDILFVLGFIFSIVTTYYYPVWWNVLMVFLYIAIALIHFFGLGTVAPGKITRAGMPVPFAIVRVFNAALNREVAHKVTTQLGGYYILVPKAEYYITVEQRNPDGSYTKIFTSSVMHADQGIINKSFNI